MRVGLISDIHGNDVAFEAVLADLARDGVDSLVCLGDVAVGPQASATVARMRALACPVVLGNWDAAFASGSMPVSDDPTAQIVNEIHAWWGGQIDDDDRAYLGSFAPRIELRFGNTDVLAYHGSPRSYDDWIFATTPDDELAPMFDGVSSNGARPQLLLGGHTHVQLARRWSRSLLVNPGSVGLPFLTWWPERVTMARRAEYAVLTFDEGRLGVDLRRAAYDVDAYLEMTRASGMPHAEWWADCWSSR